MLLHYQDEDKLYVPINQLHLISRYLGPQGNQAALDKLGSGQWEKKGKKAQQAVEDLAAKLLKHHAMRQKKRAFQIKVDHENYQKMCEDFPYETTSGQQKAIDEVLNDLQSPKAMDRLICGDVGFGKTEVALRAAFVTILAGYQVIMLAPTTLLAKQHYETFSKRFAKWPIQTLLLSSMQKKPCHATLESIGHGKVDLVIATHKLFHSNKIQKTCTTHC